MFSSAVPPHALLYPAARVYVAGHRGMVGSAIVRALERHGFTDIVGATSAELDLRDREATFRYLREVHPDVVDFVKGVARAHWSADEDFLDVIRRHAEQGVDFITVHCGLMRSHTAEPGG